jgi:ferritin-like metal-binding protein YciE
MVERDILISWLNDAYAMEKGLIETLENHAKDAEDHPQVHSRIRQHVEQTRRHGELVEECIEGLGGSTSTVKTAVGKVSGWFQGLSTGPARDELVKNALADYAAEHLEIASYNALIVAAEAADEQKVVNTCRQILREEEEMARWLEQNLPTVVREYLEGQAQRV